MATSNDKSFASGIIESNTKCAVSAAFLEAGRIANNQASKIAGKYLPVMVRGYADTPVGRLVIANLVQFAVQQYYGNSNPRVEKLTQAMVVMAYQDLLSNLKIEEMLEELFNSKAIERALSAASE